MRETFTENVAATLLTQRVYLYPNHNAWRYKQLKDGFIFSHARRTSPIKLTRFWELYNAFSGPHTNFPLALYHSIQAEQASLRDTGTKVQEKMSWAGDRHLTNILARWVSTERCSSSANCNFNFAQSFSAQRKDQAFGMPFDGLSEQQPASHHRTPRSFASATGYVNPEYTDDMMLECVHRCDQAISEGQADQKPVRNLMFIPFQPGMLIHHTITTLMRERPNDIRPLIIFPPKTYPFWQLGYWFGINRLRKTIDLCYNDGPVALIAFDNEFAPQRGSPPCHPDRRARHLAALQTPHQTHRPFHPMAS
jgi:hypothetical protein